MLKLLLDEHISPTVADGLRRRDRSLVVSCLAEWKDGEFLGQPDSACLQQAAAQGLTLVTYDRRTSSRKPRNGTGPIESASCGAERISGGHERVAKLDHPRSHPSIRSSPRRPPPWPAELSCG